MKGVVPVPPTSPSAAPPAPHAFCALRSGHLRKYAEKYRRRLAAAERARKALRRALELATGAPVPDDAHLVDLLALVPGGISAGGAP